MKRVIILLGCPGAGKGTQGRLLSGFFGLPHVSTGDIFRNMAAQAGSEGVAVAGKMNAGKLLDDDVVNRLLAQRIASTDCHRGCILDGYPRSVAQAEFLDSLLDGRTHTVAIEISIDRHELLPRLEARRQCLSCGAVFSVADRAASDLNCRNCDRSAEARVDDSREVILRRFQEYEQRTAAVLERYASQGSLHRVQGNRPVDVVFHAIRSIVLGERALAHSR